MQNGDQTEIIRDNKMRDEIFEKYPVPKAYMKLALPVVFSMVVSLVYNNMVDTYFIAGTGNTDLVAGVGIVMKINMIAALVLVGFAFGGQPLISYNYGAKNKQRLKETLKFAYIFEESLALGLMIILGALAPWLVGVFMGVVLISTCTFRSAGRAVGAFLLSVSRQF